MGERNFGFKSLESRLNRYMEEEGIAERAVVLLLLQREKNVFSRQLCQFTSGPCNFSRSELIHNTREYPRQLINKDRKHRIKIKLFRGDMGLK